MRTRRYALVQHMGDAFPELRKDVERVKAILKDEEESFSRTLEQASNPHVMSACPQCAVWYGHAACLP
jgi:alanyl-tRNA synthetase